MYRARTALAIAVLCLPAAACGGDDEPANADGRPAKARYEARMQDLLADAKRFNDAAQHNGDEAALRAAASRLSLVAKQLRALEAPAEVREAHRDYVFGFELFVRVRLSALRAASRGDHERARRLSRELISQPVRQRVLRARRAFAEQRYDITAPG